MKKLTKLLLAIVMIIVVIMPTTVCAMNQNGYTDIILEYYTYINNNEAHKIQELYGETIKEFVEPFFSNEANITNHEGIYNVKSVEVVYIEEIDTASNYVDELEEFNDVSTYFVKCDMDVYNSDKYYQQGINYFLFKIGKNESDVSKIIDVEIPTYIMLKKYDASNSDVDNFQAVRESFIYGESGMINTLGVDSPVYIDSVRNPSTIRVEGYSTAINFMDYCTVVAACEINTLENTNGARAAAMAIKMFSMHCVLNTATGPNYDVTLDQQAYVPGTTISTIASNAINYVEDYYLLGPYGEVFKTFYRTDYVENSDDLGEACCHPNGGVLPQNGADRLGATGMSWQEILKYFYTRTTSNSHYYNSEMNYGTLIVTTEHTHDWSDGYACYTCGASVE